LYSNEKLPALNSVGLHKTNRIAVVVSLVLLMVPIVGTVYPVPAYRMNYFPYIFLAYVIAGVVLVSIRSRSLLKIDGIRRVLVEATTAPALAVMLLNERIGDGPVPNLREGPA
jgi:hypothetical protein